MPGVLDPPLQLAEEEGEGDLQLATPEEVELLRRAIGRALVGAGLEGCDVSLSVHPGCMLFDTRVHRSGDGDPDTDRRLQQAVAGLDLLGLMPPSLRKRLAKAKEEPIGTDAAFPRLLAVLPRALACRRPVHGGGELVLAMDLVVDPSVALNK